ncbi:AAA family ATPase [Acidovorax citrulli]|nr:AAA family ATPase [Paracidovorax citrulli]
MRDLTGSTVLRSLDSLSTGQAALAAIFLNIIRYSDMGRPGIRLEEIAGISVIDEVDAHLHSELQTEVLPALMKLFFPRVQFVATSHAPPVCARDGACLRPCWLQFGRTAVRPHHQPREVRRVSAQLRLLHRDEGL